MKRYSDIKKIGILLSCLILFFLGSCGRKSPVVAPRTSVPLPPKGLLAISQDNVIVLRWLRPIQNTDKSKLTDLKGFVVFRREEPEAKAPPSAERQKQLKKIAEVKADNPDNAETKDNMYIFLDRGHDLPGKTLAMGVKYVYIVRSQNKLGDLGPPSPEVWAFTVASPLAPLKLKAITGEGSVHLEWEKVEKRTDGSPAHATIYYNVYRSQKQGEFPLRPVNPKPLTELRYTDTTAKNNQTYYYTVRAVDAPEFPWHESENSPTLEATPRDLTPPAAPLNLVVIPGEGYVGLIWDANTEIDLAGYYVYRSEPEVAPFQRLNDKPIILTTYRDDTVKRRHNYIYYVTAVDNAVPPNESAPSKEVKVRVP